MTQLTTETRTAVPEPQVAQTPRHVPSVTLRPAPDRSAGRELFHVLNCITEAYSLRRAVAVAEGLRTAALNGTIDGGTYYGDGETLIEKAACPVCAIGTITRTLRLGLTSRVPGWRDGVYGTGGGLTPIEDWVLHVAPGMTAETNGNLATLVEWCDQWLAATVSV